MDFDPFESLRDLDATKQNNTEETPSDPFSWTEPSLGEADEMKVAEVNESEIVNESLDFDKNIANDGQAETSVISQPSEFPGILTGTDSARDNAQSPPQSSQMKVKQVAVINDDTVSHTKKP